MFGFQPFASVPFAATDLDLPNEIYAGTGVYTLGGGDVNFLRDVAIFPDTGAYVLTGHSIEFILSISQAAISQFLLVGSTATKIRGFKMITNFTMTAGDTKTLVISVKTAEGVAVNITDSDIKWQCARSLGKASVISKTTDDSSILITNGPNGVFTVMLDPEDTEDLYGNFMHEAQVTFADGTISTVLVGTMKVNKALIEAT